MNEDCTKAKSAGDSPGITSSWTILPVEKESSDGREEAETETEPETEGSTEAGSGIKHINERCNRGGNEDSPIDDISDGISIISDCESTDRISPNIFLRDQIGDLGFDLPRVCIRPSGVQQLKPLDDVDPPPAKEQPKPGVAAALVRSGLQLRFENVVPPIVQTGLTAVFYVGVTLAILAFIGKLRHPEWQVLGDDKPLNQLEQRVGELELQNNLLRAEIDIISKQLQYLSSGHGGGRSKPPGSFKAWPGNGVLKGAVDITEDNLKKPFKGAADNLVAGVESLVDEIGAAMDDVLQAPAFQQFEKLTEKPSTQFQKPESNHYHNEKQQHQQHQQQRRWGGKEDNQSKERGQRKYQERSSSSRERRGKNEKKAFARSREEGEDDSASGEWHERRMQQREHARQKHNQKRTNNWYIERGDSREQRRSGERGH